MARSRIARGDTSPIRRRASSWNVASVGLAGSLVVQSTGSLSTSHSTSRRLPGAFGAPSSSTTSAEPRRAHGACAWQSASSATSAARHRGFFFTAGDLSRCEPDQMPIITDPFTIRRAPGSTLHRAVKPAYAASR